MNDEWDAERMRGPLPVPTWRRALSRAGMYVMPRNYTSAERSYDEWRQRFYESLRTVIAG